MLELFASVEVDWLGKRKMFFGLSSLLLLAGLASILTREPPLRYGVDFQGGGNFEVRFSERPDVDELRALLDEGGVSDSLIQEFQGGTDAGYDVLIQVGQSLVEDDLARGRELVTGVLNERYEGGFEIRNAEVVGPKVGSDLRRQAVWATLLALGGILIYIAFRFEWIYGAAAVVAVFHDTLITLGFFSIFQKEINLTVIAALLTLVGYSVNDTIVVFDRVRENLKISRRDSLESVLNRSINQTLSRTILTSGLTLVAALAMFFFGGETINSFAFALVVGVLVGTYSSIAVASPMVLIGRNYLEAAHARAVAARPQRRSSGVKRDRLQKSVSK